MAEKNEELLQFLKCKPGLSRVLTIGCSSLLAKIAKVLPQADLSAVERIEMHIDYAKIKAQCYILDFAVEKLPFPEESFDYIITGSCIEQMVEPENFARRLFVYLKPEGKLLASFSNVRHWFVLKELMEGRWHYAMQTDRKLYDVLHFFTLTEISRLFENAYYKEVQFAAQIEKAPEALLTKLEQCGFINFNGDLEVANWLVQVCKIDKATECLKSCFTAEVRLQLVFLLRRIENDIDLQQNSADFWQLCAVAKIPVKYLVAFIENTMLQVEKVLITVAFSAEENGQQETGILLLKEAYKGHADSMVLNYVLASLLYLHKEFAAAEVVLQNYSGTNVEIKQLREKIRRGNT
jgi:ubiquinone/menaquinone biosynthesis C-methylase UbiE